MLLSELKRQTSSQHQQLESEIHISEQLRSPDSYRRLLSAFYGWWRPWEGRVNASKNMEIARFFETRQKRQSIETDLQFLGLTTNEIDQIPLAQLPELNSDAELLGAMYVTEGSTLGGQIISRMIEQELGLQNGIGYSFYRSYGPQVGSRWKEFGEFFERHVHPQDLNDAVRAAREAFEGLRLWLGGRR